MFTDSCVLNRGPGQGRKKNVHWDLEFGGGGGDQN